jgi:hypothetical protein
MSIEKVFEFGMLQLAYQSFETDVKLANIQATMPFPKSQLAYQSFVKDVKLSTIPYPGEELYLKTTYNPVMFVFLGKAYLFDGSKIIEFGSPVVAIHPLAAASDGKIFVCGGMREDSTIEESIYGFGLESYLLTADRDYLAVVIPSDTVYVVDDAGNVVQTTKQSCVVSLLRNWKLVSRGPFIALVQRLL